MEKYNWTQDGDGAIAERLEEINDTLLTIANILSDITSDDNGRVLKITKEEK